MPRSMYDDEYEYESPSLLSRIGGALWTGLKVLAVAVVAAAAIITGLAMFNDKTAQWVDKHTRNENDPESKGAATWLRTHTGLEDLKKSEDPKTTADKIKEGAGEALKTTAGAGIGIGMTTMGGAMAIGAGSRMLSGPASWAGRIVSGPFKYAGGLAKDGFSIMGNSAKGAWTGGKDVVNAVLGRGVSSGGAGVQSAAEASVDRFLAANGGKAAATAEKTVAYRLGSATRYILQGGKAVAVRGAAMAVGAGEVLAASAGATTAAGLATAAGVGVAGAAVITAPVAGYTYYTWSKLDDAYKPDIDKFRNVASAEALLHKDMAKYGGVAGEDGKYRLLSVAKDGNGQDRLPNLEAFQQAIENKKAEYQEIMKKNDYTGPKIFSAFDSFGLGDSWSVKLRDSDRKERIEKYQEAKLNLRMMDSALEELEPYINNRLQYLQEAAARQQAVSALQATGGQPENKEEAKVASVDHNSLFSPLNTPAQQQATGQRAPGQTNIIS